MEMTATETTNGAAMKKAGIRTPEERLHWIISAAVSRHKRNVDRALQTVVKQSKGDDEILAMALMPHVKAFLDEGDASLPGRGHGESDTQITPAPTRQSNGDGNGHVNDEARDVDADSSPTKHGREGRTIVDAHSDDARPAVAQREPSSNYLAASRKVRGVVASDFWSRSIGGELKLGTATRFDFRQLGRKFIIGQHAVNRIVTELPWPNEDKATLKEIATEAQVKSILESSYQSLSAIDGYPNG